MTPLRRAGLAVLWALALPAPALAAETPAGAAALTPPSGAVETGRRLDPAGPFGVATGPARTSAPPPERQIEAPRLRVAWSAADTDPGALLADLRGQLAAQGFAPIFSCETQSCGGFDFRAARPVLPMPQMFVDLGAFTYLALARADGAALASLLASPAPGGGAYAQLTLIAPPDSTPTPPAPADAAPADTSPARPAAVTVAETGDLAAQLESQGRIALDGLAFQAGDDSADAAPPPVVAALAAYLKADSSRRVALVGHGDWTGSAEANLTLTRARAAAVAAMLTGPLGVNRAQISIFGAGFLAPRGSNASEAGRAANRRVEAVLLPPAP